MDQITSHLKLAELKQGHLGKAYQQLESQASAFLLLSLQWKDLEEHYGSTRKEMRTFSEELKARERVVSLKEEQLVSLQSSISECSDELTLKERELGVAKGLVEKYNEEVRLKETELVSAKERVCGVLEKIQLKERDLNLVSTKIEDYGKEILVKENVLCMITKRIEDSEKEFELKENALGRIAESIKDRSNDLNLMEKQVESVKTLIEEHSHELQSKEKLYDTMQKHIQEHSKELKLKEKELKSIESKITAKWKDKRLDFVETNIKKCAKELDSKEKELQLMDGKLKKYTEETKIKERDFNVMQKRTEEQKRELDMKEKQLQSTQSLIKGCEKEIELIREHLGLIQNLVLESSGLDSLKETVHEYASDLVLKEKENNSIQEMAKKCFHDLQLKEKQYGALKLSVEEQSQKLEMKEQQFKRRSEDLAEKERVINSSFELSNKRLADIESKDKNLELLKDSMDEQCKNLLEKEKQFKNRVTELEEKEKKLDLLRVSMEKSPKEANLGENARYTPLKRKNGQNDCSLGNRVTKLEEKEKKLDLLRVSMEKSPKEANLGENAHYTPLKRKNGQNDCSHGNSVIVHLSEGTKSSETKDGDELVRLLCEHLKMHDSIRMEVANALQTSSFPAQVVLDAMRWFYPSDMEHDGNLTKRSCFILLAELMRIPAQITTPVKTEALKMANEWKAKMKSTNENSLEALGFLHLLANYGLASSFNSEELQGLLNSLSDCKQAAYLQQALGITAKSPICATFHSVKMEQLDALEAYPAFNSVIVKKEFSTKSGHYLTPHEISAPLQISLDPAKLVLDVFQGHFSQQWRKEESDIVECVTRSNLLEQLAKMSPNIDPQVKEDAMKLGVEWSAKMTSQHEDSLVSFLQFLATYGLISSFKKEEILKIFEVVLLHKQAPELFQLLGFTQQIFDDLIQDLISSHQVLKAIKVIFGFKLVDKFHPVQILKDYVTNARSLSRRERRRKHSMEERAAVLDKEITALTDVIQCITDRNLESEFPTQNLQSRILFLQKMKANPRYFEIGPSRETALLVKDDEKLPSDIPVVNSQIVAPPTNSKGKNQPEMNHKIVHFTNNPPYKQGMKKRQRTMVRPPTFPEFPQVRDRNLMPWQFDNRQVYSERHGQFSYDAFNVGAGNYFRGPQHPPYPLNSWHRPL